MPEDLEKAQVVTLYRKGKRGRPSELQTNLSAAINIQNICGANQKQDGGRNRRQNLETPIWFQGQEEYSTSYVYNAKTARHC